MVFSVKGDSPRKYQVSGGNTKNVKANPMNLVAHHPPKATIAWDQA